MCRLFHEKAYTTMPVQMRGPILRYIKLWVLGQCGNDLLQAWTSLLDPCGPYCFVSDSDSLEKE